MADNVASSSSSCIITTLRSLTLIQPMKRLKQSATRVGSKSGRTASAMRYFNVDRRMVLSKDVWSIHEMHRKPSTVVLWSDPNSGA